MAFEINAAGNAVVLTDAVNNDVLIPAPGPGRFIIIQGAIFSNGEAANSVVSLEDTDGNPVLPEYTQYYAGAPLVLPYVPLGWGTCGANQGLVLKSTANLNGVILFTITP